MINRRLFSKITGISLIASFILTSCNATTTPLVPASTTATPLASPEPVVPTATFTVAPSLTDTPTPFPTATPTATDTAITTPQINPGMNAYCRKGPGTGYHIITFLQEGTSYNVIGQDGPGNWWLVQAPGNVDCWVGDPTSVTQGPLWQVPIVLVTPLPSVPSKFVSTSTCNDILHTLVVLIHWIDETNVTGYNIYRNGKLLKTVGPDVAGYWDYAAPLNVNVVYELEAFNDYGVADRARTVVPSCN